MGKQGMGNENNTLLWENYQQAKGDYLGLTEDHAPDTHDTLLKNYAHTMTLCANVKILSIEEFEENLEHLQHPAQVVIAYQVAIDVSPDAADKTFYALMCLKTLSDFCGHTNLHSTAVDLLKETTTRFSKQKLIAQSDTVEYLNRAREHNATRESLASNTHSPATKQKISPKTGGLRSLKTFGTRCKKFCARLLASFVRALDRQAEIDAESLKH